MFIIAVPAVAVGAAEGARVAGKGSNGRLAKEAGDCAGVSEDSRHFVAEGEQLEQKSYGQRGIGRGGRAGESCSRCG